MRYRILAHVVGGSRFATAAKVLLNGIVIRGCHRLTLVALFDWQCLIMFL